MIQTGFEEYLKKMGVETFGKAGEPFDPNLHNAVMHIEDESLGKNVVAQGLPERLPPRETASCGPPWCSRPIKSSQQFKFT